MKREEGEEAVKLLKEALSRIEHPSQNDNGGSMQVGGAYWRLSYVLEKYLRPMLENEEGVDHARFIRDSFGVISREGSGWVEFRQDDPKTWPNHGESVSVAINKEFLKEIGAEIKTYFADFSVRDDCCDFEVHHCDEASGSFAVTHWQPLPAHPAGGKKF